MKRLIFLFVFFYVQKTNAQNISIELNKNWQFKNQKENKWYKATVPGMVHTDLLANKLIPDPYYRDNESKLQWIDKADWEYRTVFNVDAQTFKKKNISVNFEYFTDENHASIMHNAVYKGFEIMNTGMSGKVVLDWTVFH